MSRNVGNVPSDICPHRSMKSTCASAQSDQSFRRPQKTLWMLGYPKCAQWRFWIFAGRTCPMIPFSDVATQIILFVSASPVSIPITWPEGTYSLAKADTGCPGGDFTWYEGWRLQDTETQSPDNAWSTDLHLDGMHHNNVDNLKCMYVCGGGGEVKHFFRNDSALKWKNLL